MSTKLIALAAAALVGTATLASADTNYFSIERTLPQTSTVDLGLVRSDAAGVVEIYDFHGGEIGALLGSTPVAAGANNNVRVNLGRPAYSDVIAQLKIDGQAVAVQDYDVDYRR